VNCDCSSPSSVSNICHVDAGAAGTSRADLYNVAASLRGVHSSSATDSTLLINSRFTAVEQTAKPVPTSSLHGSVIFVNENENYEKPENNEFVNEN